MHCMFYYILPIVFLVHLSDLKEELIQTQDLLDDAKDNSTELKVSQAL